VVTQVAGGPYPVTCSGAAAANYTFTYLPGSITVTQATVTVTASNGTMVYGATPPVITPIYAGFANGDTAAVVTTAPACTTSATGASPVGTYASTCSGAAAANYTFTYVAGTVSVTPASATVTASGGTMVYGTTPPAISPIYAGFLNGDTAAVVTTAPTCSTTATAASDVGSYPSSCAGALAANYTFAYVAGTVTVTPAAQTITFGPLANRTWGDVAFFVTASSSAGLPVTFTSATPATCTAFGITPIVFLVSPGACTIVASQAGSLNYSAATPVSQSFTIAQAATTTTLSADFDPTRIGAPAILRVAVAAASATAGTPSGSVQLFIDGASSGALVALDGTGHAVFATAAIPLGVHSLTVAYGGDTFFLGSTSPALSHTVVSRLTTTTAVSSSANPSVRYQAVTFTATITPQNASLGTAPGGTVQFTLDGANLGGPQPVNASGQAVISTGAMTVATHLVRAIYSGDTSFVGSTSPSFSQTVNRSLTTTTLTLVTPVSRQTTIRYRATVVAAAPGGGTPTGTVRFYRGGTMIGSATLIGGVAVLNYRNTTLRTGVYSMSAVYATSPNWRTSTSPSVSQRITL
jgi:hypothetical protein